MMRGHSKDLDLDASCRDKTAAASLLILRDLEQEAQSLN